MISDVIPLGDGQGPRMTIPHWPNARMSIVGGRGASLQRPDALVDRWFASDRQSDRGPVDQKMPAASPVASAAPNSSHRARSTGGITLGARIASGV